jgi:SAM-dependent methyltransferase
MPQFLLRLRNAVDYPLRQLVRWQRGGFRPAYGDKTNLFHDLTEDDRRRAFTLARRLRGDYHLAAFEADSSPVNYRENLFYLAMLEEALVRTGINLPDPVRAADIGPSHWFYVQALHALLRYWGCPEGREVILEGWEADPYRVYADLRSRIDHARGHLRGLTGASYLPHIFERQPARYDLVLMLFPFVFEKDHIDWGLPARMFQPRELLQAAWDSLKPGGILIIVNQGEEEHLAERENLAELGIPVRAAFHQDPLLFTYPFERYALAAVHVP